jgi:enoyl-CoA hydratase
MNAADLFVTVDRRRDGVAVVRIDRPDRNKLNTVMLDQLRTVAEGLTANPPGAVVIWGGELTFSAGGDPSEFENFTPRLGRLISETFHEAYDAVAAIPRATIAAINGAALGGGCELALACDFRVAGVEAQLGQPEIHMGTFPGGGGTQRLPRLVGPSVAKELIFSGEPVQAAEALRVGLVNKVVPTSDVLNTALEWAARFAGRALTAQALAKQAIDRGLEQSLGDGLALERDLFVQTFEGLQLGNHAAAFGLA